MIVKKLMSTVTAGLLCASALADDGDLKPEGGFVNEAHEALHTAYESAKAEQAVAAEKRRLAQVAAFGDALERRLLELGNYLSRKRVAELKEMAKGWTGGEINGEVPEEVAAVVEAFHCAKRGAERKLADGRLLDFDRLMRGIDAVADKVDDAGEKEKLRSEARSLLAKRVGRKNYGELEVSTFDWSFGDPRFIRMRREEDELISLAYFTGTFAGGGESQHLGMWEEGTGDQAELGWLGHSMQRDINGAALALRHPKLGMADAKVSLVEVNPVDPEKKLIHSSRGFCYFGGIWGNFGELTRAEVVLDPEDGFYYLRSRRQSDARAWAVVVEYPEGKVPQFERSVVEWKRGDPVRTPMDASEGICLMTGFSGAMHGGGELVYVRIDADGKWRVGGRSGVLNTGVKAVVLKFKE